MVLGAIAVLTVMLAEFQDETSAEAASATAERDAVQAEYVARSAVNLSRLLIATEPTIRGAVAPLFMLMKKTPPQLPVWEFSDRLLGAFNDDTGSEDFSATIGVDTKTGKNLGIKDGRFELSIVDEDAKINTNLGAANEIAHIRLAQELMGLMAPPQYNTLFEQKDGTGTFHDRLSICSAIIDWGDQDEQLFNCDMSKLTGASSSGVRGRVLPAPVASLPPQERAVRLARRAAYGPGRRRGLLGDLRRPRSDQPEEAPRDGVGHGPRQREHRERTDLARRRVRRRSPSRHLPATRRRRRRSSWGSRWREASRWARRSSVRPKTSSRR
jgi:hypothetical protein